MTVAASPTGRWAARLRRADVLASTRPEVEEALRFFAVVASWQRRAQEALETALPPPAESSRKPLPPDEYPLLRREDLEPALLSSYLEDFHDVLLRGPLPTAGFGGVLRANRGLLGELARVCRLGGIDAFADQHGLPRPLVAFTAQMVWQPPLELLGARAAPLIDPGNWYEPWCPFCGGPPLCSYLRGVGESAGQRVMVCAHCLFEWPFPRLRCPKCGEERDGGFSPVMADRYPALRLDVCAACHCYLKTADARVDGHVVALVDDIGSIPLDLWAEGQGLYRLALPLVR